MIRLTEQLGPERVKIPLEGRDKRTILAELVDLLSQSVELKDRETVLQAVLAREKILSTGIGHGVALPHGRTSAVSEVAVVAGVSPDPIPFDALDDQPVSVFFLLVGPEDADNYHVRLLGRISRLMKLEPLRQRLIEAESAETFLKLLREEEARHLF